MSEPVLRLAERRDLPAVVALLAADPLGASRERPDDLMPYHAAFDQLEGDRNNLAVVVERDGEVVGVLQLTIIPGLSRQGAPGRSSRVYAWPSPNGVAGWVPA